MPVAWLARIRDPFRRRARLRDRGASLRAMLALTGGATWICDGAGRVLLAEGPGLTGFPADGRPGERFAALWDDPALVQRWLERSGHGHPTRLSARRRGRSWELWAEPLADRGGGAVVVGADVTERQRHLDNARRDEARLRLLTESLPAMVWRVDRDLRVSEAGGAGLDALGMHAAPDGTPLAEALGLDDPEALPLVAHRRALAGSREAYPLTWHGRSFEVRLEPLRDDAGRIEGVVGLAFDVTEQKAAEREAREGRARVEAVLESVQDPVWWVDAEAKLIFANGSFQDACRASLGRPLEPGESPVEAFHHAPEVAAHWRGLYGRALAGEVIHAHQLPLAGSKGRTLWVSLYPVQFEGERLGVCCCAKDLTELARARSDLRQAEERYAQLFDTCPLPVLVTRRDDGAILAANRAAEAFYGIDRDEAAGKTTLQLGLWVDPQDRARLVEELSARGSVEGFAARYRRRGGEVRDTNLSCTTAVLDGVPCIVTLSEDVTDHKRVIAELEQSQERYRRLFTACPLPIFVARLADGRIVDLNPEAEARTGWRRAEVIGHTAIELGWWESAGAREQLLARLAREGVVRNFPDTTRLKDGSLREVQLSAAVTRLGDEPCVVTLVEDVTDQRRLEQQLRQAAKMEALGRLAGGIAHDFNNLLAVIAGQSHLLRRRLGDGHPQLPLLARIERSVERAARLTGQLLTFGRTQVLRPEPHDVNAVVRDCAQMIERIIGKDVELTSALTPEPAWSVIDRGQLEQVVMNLAVNARDAMPEGGRLVIGTEVVDVRPQDRATAVPPGSYVLVAVTDTGTGMDEKTKSRIFEPFFTTKPQGKGTGLGLAMVYGLVRQSGGHVLVDSAPGKGTTFQLYLPRTAPPAARAAPGQAEGAAEHRRALSLLLVDDEPDVRAILEEMLLDEGHAVLSAGGGEEALQLARSADRPIDVLVTDLMMPRMNGAELARRLRAERPGLRVLFISGYPGEAMAQLPPLDRSTAFLQKPFSEKVLGERLRQLVEREAPAEARAP